TTGRASPSLRVSQSYRRRSAVSSTSGSACCATGPLLPCARAATLDAARTAAAMAARLLIVAQAAVRAAPHSAARRERNGQQRSALLEVHFRALPQLDPDVRPTGHLQRHHPLDRPFEEPRVERPAVVLQGDP